MRSLFFGLTLSLSSTLAFAGTQMTPTSFPWKNGPAAGAVYKMSDYPNGVFIFEAFSITCTYCNQNAPQVRALHDRYKNNPRVQFIDLGLDSQDSDFRRWISMHKPTYPVVQDVSRKVWNALKQEDGIPQTFVVNCKGELVDYTLGLWGSQETAAVIAAISKAEQTVCQ